MAAQDGAGFIPKANKGKWGYVNQAGKRVIPFSYEKAEQFSEGLAAVQLNRKWGFIDQAGKVVIPLIYDNASEFYKGTALVSSESKHSFIDKTGKTISLLYDNIGEFSNDGVAVAKKSNKYIFVDRAGNEISPLYDLLSTFSTDGLAQVMLNNKYGFVDKAGKEIVPLRYDKINEFTDEMAQVNMDGKTGFIDNTGKEIVPVIFESILSFDGDGTAWAKLNGKWEVIDKTGKVTNKNNTVSGLPAKVGVDNCLYFINNLYVGKDSIGNTTLNVFCNDRKGVCTEVGTLKFINLRVQIISKGQEYNAKEQYLYTLLGMTVSEDKQVSPIQTFRYFFETDATPEAVIFYTSEAPNQKITIKL